MLDVAASGGRTRWLLAAAAVALTMASPATVAASTPHASERVRVFDVPAIGSCIDGGKLTLRVRPVRGVRWVYATVKINNGRPKTLKGKRITKPLTLTGLRTPIVALQLSVASYKGRLVGVLRTYRACWAIPPDGRYAQRNGGSPSFSLTDGGKLIRDVSADVALTCTSAGVAVEHLAIAEVPISADGSFSFTTTRAGPFRGSDATFTYTFEGRLQATAVSGAYRVDVAYDGGASSCTSALTGWLASPATP